MPEQTPPDTKPDAQQPAEAAPDPRADMEKLTKRELVDELVVARASVNHLQTSVDRYRVELSERRREVRPEDAMVVTALLDLHRTVGAEARQGSTIRGRKADVIAPRYLEAARTLGDELVDAILGPNAKV